MSSDDRGFSSILNELKAFKPSKSKKEILESKASHVINSAINLIEEIESTYGNEEAEYLVKRLLSSMKGKDEKRFTRAVDKFKKNY